MLTRFWAFVLLCAFHEAFSNPEELVSTLIGTFGENQDYSTGFSQPLVARPFGFNHWVPMSGIDETFQFQPEKKWFYGFRCTHKPSPHLGDYGYFWILPILGEFKNFSPDESHALYDVNNAVFRPYLFEANIIRYSTLHGSLQIRFSPSVHGGIMQINIPKDNSHSPQILFFLPFLKDFIQVQSNDTLVGYTTSAVPYRVPDPDTFKMYFILQSSPPWESVLIQKSINGTILGASLRYSASVDSITLKLATSFISQEQAQISFGAEVGHHSFESLLSEAKQAWNDKMKKFELVDVSTEEATKFYTILYRTLLFPRLIHEISLQEKLLTYTDEASTMLQGWVNAYQERGILPQWPSPGQSKDRDQVMTGTMIDCIIADAIVKNLTFDSDAGYQAIRADAYAGGGRQGIEDYINLGFIPMGENFTATCSRSLNDYLADSCLSYAAEFLGHSEDTAEFRARSKNYANLFDQQTSFFRPKFRNGSFSNEFDPFAWGPEYTESGPWQYRFYAPHDVPGITKLYGGKDKICSALNSLLKTPGIYTQNEIHEATEMRINCEGFGQLAHDNQPVHHVLWTFIKAGCTSDGQFWLRKAMSELYSKTKFSGDEDNGEMSAWYILSALGIYVLSPGSGDYVLGSPAFSNVILHLDNGNKIEIVAKNNSDENVYVSRGKLHDFVFEFIKIQKGGQKPLM